jgi:hypothetical protein
MDALAFVFLQAEGERGDARDRPGNADRGARRASDLVWDALRQQRAHRGGAVGELLVRRWIRMQEPVGEADGPHVQAVVPADAVTRACD